MAGNVSAFNTVWTYDIYQSYIRPATNDAAADAKHYLRVGRLATILGVLVSIAAAYLAGLFGNIMDFLQTIFSMINAPLFAVIFLGMFWKRTTAHGAFTGLLGGFLVALAHHGLTALEGATTLVKGGLDCFDPYLPGRNGLRISGQQFMPVLLATLLTVSISLSNSTKEN